MDVNVLFCSIDTAELERTYGSLETARDRYNPPAGDRPGDAPAREAPFGHLVAYRAGRARRAPPPACQARRLYIASEPEVEEPYATIFALDDTLELNRYRWLAEAGRLTDEDRAAIADTARRSPNVRRVGRIGGSRFSLTLERRLLH